MRDFVLALVRTNHLRQRFPSTATADITRSDLTCSTGWGLICHGVRRLIDLSNA